MSSCSLWFPEYQIFTGRTSHEYEYIVPWLEFTNEPQPVRTIYFLINQRRRFLQQLARLGGYFMIWINRQNLLPDTPSFFDIIFGAVQ